MCIRIWLAVSIYSLTIRYTRVQYIKIILLEEIMSFEDHTLAKAYWRENIRLLLSLLLIWFVVSFGFGILWVEELNSIRLGGFKLGFWFSQQGAIYSFVVLILSLIHI